jgi:hypothetical protein
VTSIRATRASITVMSLSERLTSAAPRFSFAVQVTRAEDRHDAGPSCEEPGERHLRGRGALGRGERFDRLDHNLVAFFIASEGKRRFS